VIPLQSLGGLTTASAQRQLVQNDADLPRERNQAQEGYAPEELSDEHGERSIPPKDRSRS
jgi:hypothetical protein